MDACFHLWGISNSRWKLLYNLYFLEHSKTTKRASYLLINLAVADFFVGMGVVLYIGADVAVLLGKQISLMLVDAIITVDVTATVASLSSLVLISLERMVAILWPFRHRLLKTRYFYFSIGFVWLLSLTNVISLNLRVDSIYTSVTFIVSVLVIIVAYLAIWISMQRSKIPSNVCKSKEKNRTLAKTLFIVTALSIITCLPYGIIIVFANFSEDCRFSFWVHIIFVAQFANSFLNPIVYCFRMPEFKASLKKLVCHCSRKRFLFDNNAVRSGGGITLRSMSPMTPWCGRKRAEPCALWYFCRGLEKRFKKTWRSSLVRRRIIPVSHDAARINYPFCSPNLRKQLAYRYSRRHH